MEKTLVRFINQHKPHRNLFAFSLLLTLLTALLLVGTLTPNTAGASLEGAVYVGTQTELRDAINNAMPQTPTVIALNNDITLTTTTLTIPADKNITLASNSTSGFFRLIGASGQNTITIASGGWLELAGITITHPTGVNGTGVVVNTGGNLIMTDGTIEGNTATGTGSTGSSGGGTGGSVSRGGGVYSTGNFTMTGGTISDNTATGTGGRGGSYASYTTTGTGGTSTTGGGVYSTGNFTMTGGTIEGNTATSTGGTGGTATGGYGPGGNGGGGYSGGGVYSTGNFTMTDGTISDNTATGRGGDGSSSGSYVHTNGGVGGTGASGGGVYNTGNFTMTNSAITNNNATGTGGNGGRSYGGGRGGSGGSGNSGGGIYNTGTNPTMVGNIILGNTATGTGSNGGQNTNSNYSGEGGNGGSGNSGGGVFNTGTNLAMADNTISDNNATGRGGTGGAGYVISGSPGAYNSGGGIYNTGTNSTITHDTITNNTSNNGGGIYNTGTNLTIAHDTITNNTSNQGGGIYNTGTNLTIWNSTISASKATNYGGGIYNTNSLTLYNNTITNNTANQGGGIYNTGTAGNVTMLTGLISNNSAVDGGGVYLANGYVRLLGGEISNNTASNNGGGVWVALANLNRLFVYDGVTFSDNSASTAYNRNPTHDAIYYAQIGPNVTWTTPFIQGYNNYDISYTAGSRLTRYNVTVNNSYAPITGAGDYFTGENVTVNAGIQPGYTFIGWTVNEGNITLPNTPTATFTMPEGNVVVTANWQADQTLTGTISVTKLTNPPNSETIFNFVTSTPQGTFNLTDGTSWDSGNLTIGTYTITELAQAGWNLTDIIVEGTPNYTIDLNSGTANLTLEAGQHLNLTYLNNNQQTSTVTVNKATTGSGSGSDIFYFVISPGELFSLTAGTSWNSNNLPPGTYTITEWQGPWDITNIQVTGTPNYSTDIDNRTVTFTLEAGQHINITFTNYLPEPLGPMGVSFRMDKITVPSGSEAIFDFVSSFGVPPSLGDGDYWTWRITNRGLYSVTELIQPGWELSDIIVEGTPNYLVNLSTGTVLFNPLYFGAPVFVTFVNEELPGSITVLKETLPSGALTQFNFTTTTTPGDSFTLVDGQTWNSGSLSAGTYTITELAAAGWNLTDIRIEGLTNYTTNLSTRTLTFTLEADQHANITFVNTELPGSITVLKETLPSGALTQFNFTTTTTPGDSFTLVDGQTWNSGSLSAGTYTITELAAAGWNLTDIRIEGLTNYTTNLSTRTLTFTLEADQHANITFVNTELPGSITVLKETLPSGALTQFNFTTTTTPGDSFTLVDGQTWNSGSLSAGTYTITESAQPGWDLANILVQGASNYTINLATATLTLHLNSEDVLVTFLNSEQLSPQLGSITVLKAACPTDTQTTFSYVTSAPEGVFSLINGGIWNSGPLAPGNYTVTELAQPGWDLTNIIIVNDSGSGSRVDLASGTVFVDLGLGESVTVLYQNTQQAPDLGSFSVTKVACPVGSSESFRFVTSASGGEL